MKLLLDENLSRRLLPQLAHVYPNAYVIVTKDDDFSALSALRRHPPRIIKLTLGNSDNAKVLASLLANSEQIAERFADTAVALVELASSGA